MKQFNICSGISFLLYILASFLGKSFNPMGWTNELGTLIFIAFEISIWLLPIYLNYLDGEENFKN